MQNSTNAETIELKSKVAIVFPGQGSQHLGMLSELNKAYPEIRTVFTEVSQHLGYDLWSLTQNGPEDRLNQTEYTQAAMLVADVAVYRTLQSRLKFIPDVMAGHSLGEYAALVSAGALSLVDAAKLVSMRGRIMQETIPVGQGAMAAIVGLPDEKVELICNQVSTPAEEVSPANYNAFGQIVIAGHTEAVTRAMIEAEHLGARMAKIIPVSVPCHCTLLMSASKKFEHYLAETTFETPSVAVLSNVNVEAYKNAEDIRVLLAQQLYSPVQWVKTILALKQNGIEKIVECGPGKVLSSLVKRIDSTITMIHVNDPASLDVALVELCKNRD